MKIIADTHCHTIASTHAYGTVEEMVRAAAEKGLYAIAITDHCKTMPGAPGQWYFDNLRVIPDTYLGVRVLKGAEANIIDYDGNIDLEDYLQNQLDWIVASMHGVTIDGIPTIDKVTNAYLKLADNPNINVIGHSGTPEFEYYYRTVIKKFAEKGKLIEINDSTFRYKKSGRSNCVKIAKICKELGARIIVNTDSHFQTCVGIADSAIEMLKEIDFPEELIVNTDVERFKSYLRECNINV